MPYIIKNDNVTRSRIINGRNLVKHKPLCVEMKCLSILNIINNYEILGHNEKITKTVLSPTKIENPVCFTTRRRGEIYESVIHLYQKVVMKLVHYELTKDNKVLNYNFLYQGKLYICYSFYNIYKSYLQQLPQQNNINYKKYIQHIFACELIQESLKIKSQYLLRQISDFSWVNLEICMRCVCNIISTLSSATSHELNLIKFNCKYSQTFADTNMIDLIIKCKVKYVYNNIGYIFIISNEDITLNTELNNVIQGLSNEVILYAALCISISMHALDTINIITVPHMLVYTVSINKSSINKSSINPDKEIIEILTKQVPYNNNINLYEILNKIII